MHASYLVTKWQKTGAPKKEATLRVTLECMPQLLVNAELAHARIAIAQTAVMKAVEGHIAFRFGVCTLLQDGQYAKVFVQPRRPYGASWQACNAKKFDDILWFGLGQNHFEGQRGITFFCDRKCSSKLDATGA